VSFDGRGKMASRRDQFWAEFLGIEPAQWALEGVSVRADVGLAGICKAVSEHGLSQGPVVLADATAEDEAASRWADCAVAYGDRMAQPEASGRSGRSL
jgi:hypothetical protein